MWSAPSFKILSNKKLSLDNANLFLAYVSLLQIIF